MAKAETDKRTRLIETAMKMAYKRGFRESSLADIAEAADVPVGNVYYYFKTKDEISEAIIDLRVSRLAKLLQRLDRLNSPRKRLCGFVQVKIKNRRKLARLGCPVGTLCSELRKHGSPVAKKSSLLFAIALKWMEMQFRALGKGAESRRLAVHLLSATQGVSLLAHTFHDPELITMEAARLKAWIRGL